MKRAIYLFLIVLILTALWGLKWYLDNILDTHTWLVIKKWGSTDIYQGRSALFSLWPIALTGALIGSISALIILGWLSTQVENLNYQRQIDHLIHLVSLAEKRVLSTKKDAEKCVQHEREQVAILRETLKQVEHKLSGNSDVTDQSPPPASNRHYV